MFEAKADRIRGEIVGLVTSILAASGRSGEPAAHAALAEVGMTSIDMVNLMLGVEGAFDLMIPREDLTPENFRSIESVTAMVLRLTADMPLARVA